MLDKVSTCGNLLHIVSHWEDPGWGGVGGGWGLGLGGYSVIENTQSPKICLNLNFQGGRGGGVFCN